MAIYTYGIRHHGPGSARHLRRALQELEPDILLIEAPSELEALLPHLQSSALQPPIAMLGYQADNVQRAVFYPFAEFSPEWQAMRYATERGISIKCIDLPLMYSLCEEELTQTDGEVGAEQEPQEAPRISYDPMSHYAQLTGLEDGEAWWDAMVEQRQESTDIFRAIELAISELRTAIPEATREKDLIREAYMRKQIREALKSGFERIAIVCGAWHTPALTHYSDYKVKDDNELLKGLSKVKVQTTWIPWTYTRLGLESGYGAGIHSPGWYHYLWEHPEDQGTHWLSLVAQCLRQEGKDISVAHVIEAQKLARSLAALRHLSRPRLEELNEAVVATMSLGDSSLLRLVEKHLSVSDRIGEVPDDVPKVPLLSDFEGLQKRLRLPFTAEIKTLQLDLRKPNDLERSLLLHRTKLLGIDWGALEGQRGKGTFKEVWTLYHQPEHIISLIERAIWGNTVYEACENYLADRIRNYTSIVELSLMLQESLPADLPKLSEGIADELARLSVQASDVLQMLESLAPLSEVLRYGSVRNIDYSPIRSVISALCTRILAGGVLAASHINYDVAKTYLKHLRQADKAIALLDEEELTTTWIAFLRQLIASTEVQAMLQGYALRTLQQRQVIEHEVVATRLSYHCSTATSALEVAHWLEGFLADSALVLLFDDRLWALINEWLTSLGSETFIELLPVLRRTFSEFSPAERRQLGEKAKRQATPSSKHQSLSTNNTSNINEEEAERVIPLLRLMLHLN